MTFEGDSLLEGTFMYSLNWNLLLNDIYNLNCRIITRNAYVIFARHFTFEKVHFLHELFQKEMNDENNHIYIKGGRPLEDYVGVAISALLQVAEKCIAL